MMYKATELIAQTFDNHGIKYRVVDAGEASIVEAGFVIDARPDVIVRFISKDDDNDVAIRVFGLVHHIPSSKKLAMMEACNRLNTKIRFLKFYLNSDSDINVDADLPVQTDDQCVGECCFELFIRIMSILNNEYHVLAEALYGNTTEDEDKPLQILRALKELRDTPIVLKDEESA